MAIVRPLDKSRRVDEWWLPWAELGFLDPEFLAFLGNHPRESVTVDLASQHISDGFWLFASPEILTNLAAKVGAVCDHLFLGTLDRASSLAAMWARISSSVRASIR
jgi:hypothetical protein